MVVIRFMGFTVIFSFVVRPALLRVIIGVFTGSIFSVCMLFGATRLFNP